MLNRVVLVGRMVRNPELRRTGNGVAVVSFTIAMNRNFTNQQGERQADFIPCIVWNKAAENKIRTQIKQMHIISMKSNQALSPTYLYTSPS